MMTATARGEVAPRRWVERLIADLCVQEDTVYAIVAGEGLSFAELMGRGTPEFAGDWWTVETASWWDPPNPRPLPSREGESSEGPSVCSLR